MPKSTYNIPLPPSWGPPVANVEAPPRDTSATYGAYLIEIAHCMEYHSPMVNQRGAGVLEIPRPWGIAVTANVTPHEDGIAGYSDDDIKAAITTGKRPDGSPMMPPMAYGYYAHTTADDPSAIVAHLRTLEPRPHPK